MSVSAIVPYYSASASISPYLALCLSSLLSEGEAVGEVILVVNGPCDPELSEPPLDCLTIVRALEPLGYGAAINIGTRYARHDYLLFCDADIYSPNPGWVRHHLEIRQKEPNVGISASKLVNHRTDRVLDFGIGRARYNHFHPGRDLPVHHPSVGFSRPVQMACSALMMIERSLFLRLGGFDEVLRHHYQDLDLCLRIKRENLQVWVLGNSVAYHRSASAGLPRTPFKIDERAYYTAKNAALMMVDYASYLRPNLNAYRHHLSSEGPMALIDISTMTEPNEATDIIREFGEIIPLRKAVPSERDLETLTLVDMLDPTALRHHGPLLLLVDRAWSLQFNGLWRAARDTTADIVVDRHANVCLFDELCQTTGRRI